MLLVREPTDLSLRNAQVATEVRRWFAIYTASKHEKRVAQHLEMKDIETFLPLYSITKRWKNRTTAKLELPIFPGYVFARFSATQRTRVVEVPMVYSIVSSRGSPTPVPDEEVARLRAALEARQAHPYPYVKIGNRVRVRSGPLVGLEGIVVRTYGGLSVVLSVDMIQKSVAVHVEADELESCSSISDSLI